MNYEKIENQITHQLVKKKLESKTDGFVLGLSGGIDSAVVASLCAKSKIETVALTMPCESEILDEEHANLVGSKFDIDIIHTELFYVFERFERELYSNINYSGERKKIADANLKARLRMSALYHVANVLNYLVVGTGNKTEIMIGYFTKYGDGGCDIEPIGELYKTEVFEFAKYLKIPNEIINKPPSAGLWEGQTDENEIGYTYKELDAQLQKFNIGETCDHKIVEMIKRNQHKLQPPQSFRIEK